MTEKAIVVENLSKRYRIGVQEERPRTFVAALTNLARRPVQNFRRLRQLSAFDDRTTLNGAGENGGPADIIWALRDVSFEVKQGEVIGVIGRNGAGKSTLLKILSRITYPTGGRVTLNGRVSSLLEVGTGFHPEMTGRENVYLNGTILGMTKKEIDSKFDEIVDFSGVEKFIDTPVKRYSSGMRVRLAFSVAAHLEPEILIIDEVLAVGDIEFQKKCLGKMEEVAIEGRTVLFVSHQMAAVSKLCTRAILLNQGLLVRDSDTESVIQEYLASRVATESEVNWGENDEAPGDDNLRISYVRVSDEEGKSVQEIDNTKAFVIEVGYEVLREHKNSRVGFQLVSGSGIILIDTTDQDSNISLSSSRNTGRYISRCTIPGYLLNQGNYHLNLIAHIPRTKVIAFREGVVSFSITYLSQVGLDPNKPGLIRPKLDWVIEGR